MDNMIGKKFNRLLIIRYDHKDKWRSSYYECLCDCGNFPIVKKEFITSGKTKSCGCLQKEIVSKLAKENNPKRAKNKIENFTKDKNGFLTKESYFLNTTCFVYKLTNLINGKIYIGKTERDLKYLLKRYNRLLNTKKKYKRYIDNALIKYGLSNFILEIIELCQDKDINEMEKYYIKIFNTKDKSFGYNLTDGGDGTIGYQLTKENRKNISNARIGKFMGKDNPFYGKHHSDKTKTAIAESNKRRKGVKNNVGKYTENF